MRITKGTRVIIICPECGGEREYCQAHAKRVASDVCVQCRSIQNTVILRCPKCGDEKRIPRAWAKKGRQPGSLCVKCKSTSVEIVCPKCGFTRKYSKKYASTLKTDLCQVCRKKYYQSKRGENITTKEVICECCGESRRVQPSIAKRYKTTLCKKCKNLGENNPFYIDGRYTTKYSPDWKDGLREEIRHRSEYRCSIPSCRRELTEDDYFKKLAVHHIDYDKHNCDRSNLIALCPSCHGKTHHNREYWIEYLPSIVEDQEMNNE